MSRIAQDLAWCITKRMFFLLIKSVAARAFRLCSRMVLRGPAWCVVVPSRCCCLGISGRWYACSACKSPLRGEFRCRVLSQFTCIMNNCFPQLSLFLKSALSNHSFSLNRSPRNPHPYSFSSFEVAKRLLVFSAVILLLLFKLLGRKPTCKSVGLFLFFLPSDSAILNSLIFYLTHKTFWLGSCPFFYF